MTAVLATCFSLILLLATPGLARSAQGAGSAGALEGGGCRAAYDSNGFKNTYPCISVSGGYFRADSYTAGLPAGCSYYIVYLIEWDRLAPVTGGRVANLSSHQPCNRVHSDIVLYRDSNTPWTYISRITVFNSSNAKIGSLESPRVWT
ncbi:hypothetical protein [Nonomuraea sp. NPDC049709]|uniref:hypothetical protein n=1 Tax=Nonomuraea sp. NPDC049709 TaxID=3154736 RepID=UPI00343F5B23